MIKADLILDTRLKAKKGYPVKIRIYCDIEQSHKYISLKTYQNNTELKLDADLRKRSSQLDEEVKFCNDNFYKIKDAIDIIKNGVPLDDIDLEIELLEKRLELLRSKKGSSNGVGLLSFIDKLIIERSTLKIPTKSYTILKSVLKRFIHPLDDININSITREWINEFDLNHKKKELKDSSVNYYIAMIKSIYKEAQSRNSLNIKSDNPFIKLRVYNKQKKETELTVEDLILLKDLDKKDIQTNSRIYNVEYTKKIADLYLFQFAIGGHDFLDIASLKWDSIKENRIIFKRQKNRFKKSGGEYVNNMLNDFCLGILERYGDRLNNRVFSFLPDPETENTKYLDFLARLNTTVFPNLAKSIETANKFTSKSTRYLFRTTAGNLLINDLIIMKLQGHTPQGITFGYQGAINHEVQDKEHQKILDLVFNS